MTVLGALDARLRAGSGKTPPLGTNSNAAAASTTAGRSVVGPAVLLGVLVLVAILAPVLAPHPPNAQLHAEELKLLPPSFTFPFGTDQVSRDVLSRVIYGARVSLEVAAGAVSISLAVGIVFGALTAFSRGRTESVLLRTLDVLLSIPRILIVLTLSSLSPDTLGVGMITMLLGFTGWYDVARLVHGELRGLIAREFITAARATGVRSVRLVARHMIPHLVPVLSVVATLGIANTIATEAGLRFLGVGGNTVSWGSIMRDGSEWRFAWWLTVFPGLAILLAVTACNGIGDALRQRAAHNQLHA